MEVLERVLTDRLDLRRPDPSRDLAALFVIFSDRPDGGMTQRVAIPIRTRRETGWRAPPLDSIPIGSATGRCAGATTG
jgi:hypothetical protein